MKPNFHSFIFPGFQSLTLSFKAASLGINKANAGVNQRAVRATLQPVKAFFLVTYLPTSVPAEVEQFMDLKVRLLEMAFYWMGWAFVYGIACTLGLYLFLILTSFCVGQLGGKRGKRTMIGTSVEELKEKIYSQEKTQVQLT